MLSCNQEPGKLEALEVLVDGGCFVFEIPHIEPTSADSPDVPLHQPKALKFNPQSTRNSAKRFLRPPNPKSTTNPEAQSPETLAES